MQTNFLEELVAEWYEYQGYLVKRNEHVGRNPNGRGGNQGELDVVAFKPATNHLLHVETSTAADSWSARESKFRRKFACGIEHIKYLFEGMRLPETVHQCAVFAYGSDRNHRTIGGGEVRMIEDLLTEILDHLKDIPFSSRAVPEKYPVIRVLQMVAHLRN
jgi:hypothetical protein